MKSGRCCQGAASRNRFGGTRFVCVSADDQEFLIVIKVLTSVCNFDYSLKSRDLRLESSILSISCKEKVVLFRALIRPPVDMTLSI